MTKTEMIAELSEAKKTMCEALNLSALLAKQVSDQDASVSILANLTIATTVCDTMTNLTIVLCELFAKEDHDA